MKSDDNNNQLNPIAVLNDKFRTTGKGGIILITKGISCLPEEDRHAIAKLLREFNTFTEDNDPHGEHDFGSILYQAQQIFWKIDYYAKDMMDGSENPLDSQKTTRVLTVMLAAEY